MSNIHVKNSTLKEINETVQHRQDDSWTTKINKLLDKAKGKE